jgi:class 3 adenylate cyclase
VLLVSGEAKVLFLLTAVAAVVLLTVFIAAVQFRWFSRFRNGFSVSLAIGIGGLSVVVALLYGLWGYSEACRIFLHTLHTALSNVAMVVEDQTGSRIRNGSDRLARLGAILAAGEAAEPAADIDAELLRKRLMNLQRYDPRLLQIQVTDPTGKLLVTACLRDGEEPLDRTAVGYDLGGQKYISHVFYSKVFERNVFSLGVPIRTAPDAPVLGSLTALYDIQDDLVDMLHSVQLYKTADDVLVDANGRVLADDDPKNIGKDFSSLAAVRQGREGNSGWLVESGPRGNERLYVYRPIRNPATVNPRSWVLLTSVEAKVALAPMRVLAMQFAAGLGIFLVGAVLVALRLSSSIHKPVGEQMRFADAVRQGDLNRRIEVVGRDEMAQLAESLNEMVKGLQERDRVKDVFGRYVTKQVSEKILKGQLKLGGERRRVTVLFSDIRNFTTMSETMPPEEVVALLNDYFSEMVEAVFEQNGVLDKFIGDGMLAVFGSLEEMPDHPRKAALAALRMKALLGKVNAHRASAGQPALHIGIGIHTAEVVVGNIGSRRRLEYTVVGDGVNTCSRVESLNKTFGTTILVTESTRAELGDEFEYRLMPETPVKGKTQVFRVFELVGRKAAAPAQVAQS